MDRTKTYRVYNHCKYAIGVVRPNGHSMSIDPVTPDNPEGGFQLLTGDEILFIENRCKVNKFFAKKMLVAYDENGVEVPLESFHIVPRQKDVAHLDDATITEALKQSQKKFEAWLEPITDPAELDAIYLVARETDSLTKGKLDVLKNKIPNKDWN